MSSGWKLPPAREQDPAPPAPPRSATPLPHGELLGAAPPPPPPGQAPPGQAPPGQAPPAPAPTVAPPWDASTPQPWGAVTPQPTAPERPERDRSQQRLFATIAAGFLLLGSALIGFGARDGWFTRSGTSTAPSTAQSSIDTTDSANGQAVGDEVDDAIVNITTSTSGGVGAGTGMIISSKGLVLTNHHVISGAEELEVELGGIDGDTYRAHVVGYSLADDIALVQIEGVSGLRTIATDETVSPNEQVLVMGNALGRGGTPTVSPGTVVALGQQITATDERGGNAETLIGMIQIQASVQPGQSGGAVVDGDGEVVGMTTAASVRGGYRFGFEQGSNEAYAIPIARAMATADAIRTGESNDEIHVGPRGVLGVTINPNSFGSSAGVPVSSVTEDGPAHKAGIVSGSVIVSIGDTTVRTADDITVAMNRFAPGDEVKVTWLDDDGNRRSATVELDEGPPA